MLSVPVVKLAFSQNDENIHSIRLISAVFVPKLLQPKKKQLPGWRARSRLDLYQQSLRSVPRSITQQPNDIMLSARAVKPALSRIRHCIMPIRRGIKVRALKAFPVITLPKLGCSVNKAIKPTHFIMLLPASFILLIKALCCRSVSICLAMSRPISTR